MVKRLAQLVLHRVSRGRVHWARFSSPAGFVGREKIYQLLC